MQHTNLLQLLAMGGFVICLALFVFWGSTLHSKKTPEETSELPKDKIQ
jgi:hypothetical protein